MVDTAKGKPLRGVPTSGVVVGEKANSAGTVLEEVAKIGTYTGKAALVVVKTRGGGGGGKFVAV